MLLLLLAASVPVVGIAGANAVLSYEAELAAGRRTARILGDVAAARHGAAIELLQDTLNGLARDARMLAAGDACAGLVSDVAGLYRGRFGNVWVTEPDGRLRCSALPAPADSSMGRDPAFRASLAANTFTLSPFRQGRASDLPVVTATLPIRIDGELRGVVAASLLLNYFIQAETRGDIQDNLKGWAQRIWLVDSEATALPLTRAAITELPDPGVLRRLRDEPGPTSLEIPARGGADFAYASTQLDSGLRLLVGLPTGEIRRAADTVLARRAAELAAFLLACLVVIVLGADIAIARPLRSLAWRVRAWRPGAAFGGRALRGEPDEVRALEQAFTDAASAISARQDELRAALRQRDLLMAEIHHRVKNNLQIVASLLNLQAGRLRDPKAKAEFATARDRVQALATLHRHLYTNQTFEVIALRPFLEELAQQLFAALGERPGQRITLSIEADELEIVTDQAVSLALLITETVTNAIKHGFADARSGTLTISVRADPRREGEEEDQVVLRVHDDGIGLRLNDDEPGPGQGIGLTLIRGFAQHLGGEIDIQGEGGTEMTLRFPLRRREAEPAVPTRYEAPPASVRA
ncbi:sensor histidine kinase [Roseomonas sp. 18066]|uniref:sensor histidine kinase n=1 Tax=Roseomonas sp. 18066 TaxID=2681412 RepID=UPI0013571ED1|nr:histidine kinase dimerization/phosphoacceptor domain -containing protein [Roseomonas sp. 18066]